MQVCFEFRIGPFQHPYVQIHEMMISPYIAIMYYRCTLYNHETTGTSIIQTIPSF